MPTAAPTGSAATPAPEPAPPKQSSSEPSVTARPRPARPPTDLTPPHERSAQAGDGKWVSLAGTPFYKTTIHPHPASRFIEVTVVAIDLGQVSLHHLPGTDDVGDRKVSFGPGLVPADERSRLVSVFNGSFQPRHGHWGIKTAGVSIVPPRDQGCTVALYQDDTVRIGTWTRLADTEGSMRGYRQTPPCLLEEGALHPDLLAGRDRAWGGNAPGIVTRRRSALGIDASQTTLYYAVGVEASPGLLGEALQVAGASAGTELDINWNWTRFFVFSRDESGALRISLSLVEVDHGKTEYLERASERDFFYLLRRSGPQ